MKGKEDPHIPVLYFGIRDLHGHSFCVDATKEKNSLAKMVNDSQDKFANAVMKRMVIGKKAHLCLFAIKHIQSGTELRKCTGAPGLWHVIFFSVPM